MHVRLVRICSPTRMNWYCVTMASSGLKSCTLLTLHCLQFVFVTCKTSSDCDTVYAWSDLLLNQHGKTKTTDRQMDSGFDSPFFLEEKIS